MRNFKSSIVGAYLGGRLCDSVGAIRLQTICLFGLYMGWYNMTFSLAAVLAPTIGAGVYQWNRDAFWYIGIAIGCLVLAGFYWLASRLEPEASTTDQS